MAEQENSTARNALAAAASSTNANIENLRVNTRMREEQSSLPPVEDWAKTHAILSRVGLSAREVADGFRSLAISARPPSAALAHYGITAGTEPEGLRQRTVDALEGLEG